MYNNYLIVINITLFTCNNSISQKPSKSSNLIGIDPDLLSNSSIKERICINLSVVKSFVCPHTTSISSL